MEDNWYTKWAELYCNKGSVQFPISDTDYDGSDDIKITNICFVLINF